MAKSDGIIKRAAIKNKRISLIIEGALFKGFFFVLFFYETVRRLFEIYDMINLMI